MNKLGRTSFTDRAEYSPFSLLLLGIGLVLALVLVWLGREVLMLLFAAIVLAIFLSAAAGWLRTSLRLNAKMAYGKLVAVSCVVVFLTVWLLGPSVLDQFSNLQMDLPPAVHKLIAKMDTYPGGHWLLSQWSGYAQLTSSITYGITRIGGIVVSTASIVAGFFVVGFIALYVAAEPELYLAGIRRAIPARYIDVVSACGTNAARFVRWWLLSQILSMISVGVLVWIGLLTLGIPLAGTLGLIAATLTFIPNVGPILSVLPAGLLALAISPTKGLLTIGLFLLVHFLEGNLITPLLERKIVRMPPALTMTAQLIFAMTVGPIGVALAAPITAAALGFCDILLPTNER